MQEIYEIIRLAKDYIAVGIVLAAAFLVGYFLMHIKKKNKNKKSNPLWAVFFAAFICYMCNHAQQTRALRNAVCISAASVLFI